MKVCWHSSKRSPFNLTNFLTGKRRNGGFFTPFPRFSSWNWISWETSWAMDLAVGGSLCTYWNVKKIFGWFWSWFHCLNRVYLFGVLAEPPFDMFQSRNGFLCFPKFGSRTTIGFGLQRCHFCFRLSAVCSALQLLLIPKQLEKPTPESAAKFKTYQYFMDTTPTPTLNRWWKL